ncbi:MAG: chromosome partitioning protein [Myxococcales bacterium]|nr:chromosome partitioning protein [Myxococcales bacterium]
MPASPAPPLSSLLERRLVIVTGKGGTGKTTVCAALALAAAQRGLRVLVAEVARSAQVPHLLDPNPPDVGYEAREVLPGIRAMRIDPFSALAEYIGLQLGLRNLVERFLRSAAFRQLMDASPGWRELITLGKIWHLERMRDGDRPRHDLIVVDAPATGHGVSFLEVPRVVLSAVRGGPLRHHTEAVEALLEDSARTTLLPVARAEELPARETAQLVDAVRARLSIPIDRVVVNAVHPAPFPPHLADLDERLARLPQGLPLGALPEPATLAACARYLRARHELNRGYVVQIARSTGLPLVCLPYLRDGLRGRADVEALGRKLLEEPRAAA